jgi:hypothetical protein
MSQDPIRHDSITSFHMRESYVLSVSLVEPINLLEALLGYVEDI